MRLSQRVERNQKRRNTRGASGRGKMPVLFRENDRLSVRQRQLCLQEVQNYSSSQEEKKKKSERRKRES